MPYGLDMRFILEVYEVPLGKQGVALSSVIITGQTSITNENTSEEQPVDQ